MDGFFGADIILNDAEDGSEEAAIIELATRYDDDGDTRISIPEFTTFIGDLVALRDGVLHVPEKQVEAVATEIARAGFPELDGTNAQEIGFEIFIELGRRWSDVLSNPAVMASLGNKRSQLPDLHDPMLGKMLDALDAERTKARTDGGGEVGKPAWVYASQPGSLLTGQLVPEAALLERDGWHFHDHGNGEGVIYWWPAEAERSADARLVAHPVCFKQNDLGPKPYAPPSIERIISSEIEISNACSSGGITTWRLPGAEDATDVEAVDAAAAATDAGAVVVAEVPAAAEMSEKDKVCALVESRLDAMGFQSKELGGGGDCFFRVLAYGVYGNQEMHAYIRHLVVEKLREMDPNFFPDHDREGYCNQMARQGKYCNGQREMLAACRALNVNLHVFGSTGEHDRTFSPSENVGPTNDVLIAHYNHGNMNDHFKGVEPKAREGGDG